jgi:hypothetical protein
MFSRDVGPGPREQRSVRLPRTYNRLELAADPGQMLTIWTAKPGSTSAEALSLLGSRPRRLGNPSTDGARARKNAGSSKTVRACDA